MPDFVNDYKCLNCKHCFRKSVLFNYLKDDELDHLNSHRLEVHFKQGEVIFKQGSPFTHIVILHTGLGKSYIEGFRDRNLIIGFVKPYEINCSPGMYVDGRHHCSMSAVTDVGACFVEVNAFKKIVGENSRFSEEFIRFMSEKTIHTFNRFLTTTQKNMEGRIAEALLYFSNKIFTNGQITHVTKQDFADFTSMTRESAIRVLKEFKDEGVIDEHDKSIEILDEKALVKYADLG